MKLLSTRNVNTLIIAAAAVILLFFLLSYSETGSPPVFNAQNKIRNQAEFFITKTVITQFNQQGELDMIISSEHIEQNPHDDSIDLDRPRLNLFREGEPSWNIRAQIGVIYDNGNKVDLEQRVVVVSNDRQSMLKTPHLTVFPNEKTANTDRPVTLVTNNGFTKAMGLQADLNTKHIDLLSKVRGQYEPEAISEYVE